MRPKQEDNIEYDACNRSLCASSVMI